MNTVIIKLNDHELNELDRLSQKAGETRERFILSMLKRLVSDELVDEDAQDALEAGQAWDDFVASGEKGYTIKEARKELGL